MQSSSVKGYGQGTDRNVFGVAFDENLSSLITYHCFDNDQTFPNLEAVPLTSTTNTIFRMLTTESSPVPMISLVDVTNSAPVTGDHGWIPRVGSSNAAVRKSNRMMGDSAYVTQEGSIIQASVGASGYLDGNSPQARFNMACEVPSTVLTTDAMGFELKVKYTYTGSAPTPLFVFNSVYRSGTEAVPIWETIVVSTSGFGIKHTRTGASSAAPYANIPSSGSEYTVEGWVLTATASYRS